MVITMIMVALAALVVVLVGKELIEAVMGQLIRATTAVTVQPLVVVAARVVALVVQVVALQPLDRVLLVPSRDRQSLAP